ncbi:type I restriction enzyme S subunit [Pseudarthrobacter oxydans]|uniref:Type I restriction enzyme S subunit n=2 Tax=Pseudarthrobacter oxydans TaxID=1671 RepID=A0AAW8NEW8_PSEOX|nr:type I restriction enzyme S subunit [Pseudarthrobacter oxydans]
MFVKDFRGNHPRWVYHYFENTDLAGYDSGSVQPMLNRNYIAHIPVLVPSTQEQRAIADVLGALDDKIAVNSKLAETSDELVSLHFRRAIESEGTASRPLFEAIDIDFGEPFGGSDFSAPGIGRPLIRIRDLKTFTSQVWTTEIRSREILVQPGDVVVGMDAEFRPTSWLGEPGLLNQRVCRARGKSTGPAFVRETLREPLRRIEGYKAATTVIHLNKKDLQEAEVLVPDTESLELFEASVEGLYSRRVAVAIENRALEAVRDALLPQLMSGKLRVRDAEKVLENAGV